jgi:hypothetical protein
VTGVISRICNIDVTTLTKDASTGADLISMMVDAYYARDVAMLGDGKKLSMPTKPSTHGCTNRL